LGWDHQRRLWSERKDLPNSGRVSEEAKTQLFRVPFVIGPRSADGLNIEHCCRYNCKPLNQSNSYQATGTNKSSFLDLIPNEAGIWSTVTRATTFSVSIFVVGATGRTQSQPSSWQKCHCIIVKSSIRQPEKRRAIADGMDRVKIDAAVRPTGNQIFSIRLSFLSPLFPFRFLSHFLLQLLSSFSFCCFSHFHFCFLSRGGSSD
jgi:hypothetical protein